MDCQLGCVMREMEALVECHKTSEFLQVILKVENSLVNIYK